MSNITFTTDPTTTLLLEYLKDSKYPKIIILCDSNTRPIAENFYYNKLIEVPAGELSKSFSVVLHIINKLDEYGCTRNTLLVNVGGGMITDLGGFVASIYMRGIDFINIPTTILGSIDASIGGKTGINYGNAKNHIGTFHKPILTIISTNYFNTLPKSEVLSGYGEILKYSLLDKKIYKLSKNGLSIDLIKKCVLYKDKITNKDPKEKSIRKYLNLGHTIGHAIESYQLSIGESLPHGQCVAYGLIVTCILSEIKYNFSVNERKSIFETVIRNFGYYHIPYEIIDWLKLDKKNTSDSWNNFVLLKRIGKPIIDVKIDNDEVFGAISTTNNYITEYDNENGRRGGI